MHKNKKTFIHVNRSIVSEKMKESFTSIMPVTAIILLICFTLVPVQSGAFLAFLIGALMLIVGMGLFSMGADTAMTPIGQYIGSTAIRKRKIWLLVLLCFIVGVLITISEPDLHVLSTQVSEIPKVYLIGAVGIGVGIFLAIACLRIVFSIKFKYLLVAFYSIIFIAIFFIPKDFVAIAFDAGGVTTGPISVPFIIAIGTGIASLRSDKNADNDSFGLTALCSIGPIMAVLLLGLVFKPSGSTYTATEIVSAENSRELIVIFLKSIPEYMKEVGIALLPIICFYLICKLFGAKQSKADFIKILVGVLYTYVGLVLFLVGINVGFLPIGTLIGQTLGNLDYNWIIVPIGMVIGFFIIAAEPAVPVLTKQVHEVTGGAVPQKALRISLMIGMAISVGLALIRILCHIPILYFLIPGYVVAITLSFFVPDIFTAVAFDAGGVASGAMTASFLLPMGIGLCTAVGGNVITEGFGMVAMVAMTPLITIQVLGLYSKIQRRKLNKQVGAADGSDSDIIS